LGVVSGPLGLAALGLAASLGYEGGHKPVTVIFWAVLGVGLAGAAAVYWLSRYRQRKSYGTDTNVNYGQQDVGINKGKLAPEERSHGILIEDCENIHVEGNEIAGTDVAVGQYRSRGGSVRNNRIDGALVSGDQNINFGYQEVGINKGNIFRETPPRCDLMLVARNEKRGDYYVTSYVAALQGRPAMLGIRATGSGVIERVDAHHDGRSGMLEGTERGGLDQGTGQFMTWRNPDPGRYRIEIQSSEPLPEDVEVAAFDRWV
jgi:hypothetical protein